LHASGLQSEDELLKDINAFKRENRKKAIEKEAKRKEAVTSLFGVHST